MSVSANALGGIAVAAFALPALGFALGPVFDRGEARWEDVGAVGDFPETTYVPRVITLVPGIGEAGKSTIYVRKHNPSIDGPPKDRYDDFVAISTRCAHLGCPVRYIEASTRFVCPCHGGVYDFQGKVTGGPPVRPLDRFYTRVRGGRVEIGPRYSVNSHLRRFSPRDPGQALDGIGQYAYPGRFSTPSAPPGAQGAG
ncbi:MAG TPA: Rieske 2Fe-2S domain-containing protein [Solirubrobacteraceae bacterium]|jgi:Rieske Fe-S protein|nr:Rieske 2Fe-2S domain-containing protein [Solirubrobacteraceae bacterium]